MGQPRPRAMHTKAPGTGRAPDTLLPSPLPASGPAWPQDGRGQASYLLLCRERPKGRKHSPTWEGWGAGWRGVSGRLIQVGGEGKTVLPAASGAGPPRSLLQGLTRLLSLSKPRPRPSLRAQTAPASSRPASSPPQLASSLNVGPTCVRGTRDHGELI